MKSSLKLVALSLVFFTAFCSIKVVTAFSIPLAQAQSVPADEAITKDWYNYTARDRSYQVKFPGQPSEAANVFKNSAFDPRKSVLAIYSDRARQHFYTTTSYKYPIRLDVNNVEKYLNSAIGIIIKNSDYTIIREIKISLNGISGRELMGSKTGETTLTRTFIDPNARTLCVASVVFDGNIESPEARAFINSFAPVKSSQ